MSIYDYESDSNFPNDPQRFSMTYKRREADIYVPIEIKLCHEMGLTRCDLHKEAIKRLHNSRQQNKLQMV